MAVRLRTGYLAAVLALGAPTALAQPVKPVDEGGEDAAFAAFRTELREAVRAHDVAAIVAHADPNIRLGFGGRDGAEQFRANLQDEADAGEYWAGLARALTLGGVFADAENTSFCSPYPSCIDLGPQADPFSTAVLIHADVPVRAAPADDAAILQTLSYAQVALEAQEAGWGRITLPDGRAGYVSADDYQTPAGWRAMFNRIDGAWRMTMFLAGD